MLLAVDIGNTKIAFGLFDGEDLTERWSIRTDQKKTADEYLLLIRQLFDLRGLSTENVHAAIMASVAPQVERPVGAALASLSNAEVLIVGKDTKLGVRNLYENPEEVGADRLANAVAGRWMRGAPVIVVDFGTATTFDVVTPEGDYAGGVIMPGMEMSAQALFTMTAKLPRVTPKKPKRALGRTTVASIRSGLYFGYLAAVDGLIERLRAEAGGEWPVLATGGSAATIAAESRYIEHVEPDLTLHGLRIIWDMNQ